MFQAVGMAGYCLIAMDQTFSMYIRTHIEPQKNNFQKQPLSKEVAFDVFADLYFDKFHASYSIFRCNQI